MDNNRVFEIDLLRFVAIILMIVFHIVYDIDTFTAYNINYSKGFWYFVGRSASIIFIFTSGLSSGFSKKTIKRGILLIVLGLLISVITYVLFKSAYIRFGILSLLGVSMILSPALKKLSPFFLIFTSLSIFYIHYLIRDIVVTTSILIPLGLTYQNFYTLDYFPIIPNLSFYILGLTVYKLFYQKHKSLFFTNYTNKYVTLISKKSLLIYLLHQPLILVILMLIITVLK